MELNGRMWGSLALARRQGLEYPAWAVAEAMGAALPELEDAAPPDPGEMRHLGRELLHLLFVVKGPRSSFHRESWPSLRVSLRQVLRPSKGRNFYNHDPAFPRFYLRDAWQTVKGKVRR